MFLKFDNDKERYRYGMTAFMELYYCKMDGGTPLAELFKVDNMKSWNYDHALFISVDDEPEFFDLYRELLGVCLYVFNDRRKSGLYDVYDDNYFKPECIEPIMERILEAKPKEYEIMVEWLEGAKEYNGFFLRGM